MINILSNNTFSWEGYCGGHFLHFIGEHLQNATERKLRKKITAIMALNVIMEQQRFSVESSNIMCDLIMEWNDCRERPAERKCGKLCASSVMWGFRRCVILYFIVPEYNYLHNKVDFTVTHSTRSHSPTAVTCIMQVHHNEVFLLL